MDNEYLSSLAEVNYTELPPQSPGRVKLIDGKGMTLRDGKAQVEVHRVQDAEGLFIRIYNDIGDGQKSALKFRLTDEAATALCSLLFSFIS